VRLEPDRCGRHRYNCEGAYPAACPAPTGIFCGERGVRAKKSIGTILSPVTFVDLTEKYESDEETR
jgi:hypothetical protein